MSYAILATLNASIVIPTRDDLLANDAFMDDATAGLKERGLDQFKMHLLASLGSIDVAEYFAGYEEAYKAKYNATAMCKTYRPIKSILSSCIKYSIPVVAADGYPRGKSELDKAIKEAKTAETSLLDKATAAYDAFMVAFEALEDVDDVDFITDMVRNKFA